MRLDRVVGDELMDRADADPAALARSLRDLTAVNRWLGVRSLAIRLVWGLIESMGEGPIRVLDVGTGAGDIPAALARRARAGGRDVRITATDIHPTTLAFARTALAGVPSVEVIPADALELPFPRDRFDVVMCHTLLHHFDESSVARALGEMDRVARLGVVVTDLTRSWPALWGVKVLAGTVWRDHLITRHDGPASVRAAFTTNELREIADRALDPGWTVRSRPLFRLSLVMDRTGRSGRQKGASP